MHHIDNNEIGNDMSKYLAILIVINHNHKIKIKNSNIIHLYHRLYESMFIH